MLRLCLTATLTLAAHSALAIDCNRAKSDIERAICGDAEARAADHALGAAFDRLRGLLPDDERTGLRSSQIKWIQTRDGTCLANRADTALSKCIARESEKRRRFLEGRPATGDTEEDRFRPVFIFHPPTRNTARLSVEAIKFTGSGAWQAKANASIDKMVKDAIDDLKLNDNRQPTPGENYFVELHISLPFATQRLLSVHAEYNNYLGQAHPYHWSTNINMETSVGRELTFDSSIAPDKASELFQYCRSQVVKQKSDAADVHGLSSSEASNVGLQEVIDGTKKFSDWSFSKTGVVIDYGDYAFGGYGACMCMCTVPYSQLRPVARHDLPLP